jgi:hypothetical protein
VAEVCFLVVGHTHCSIDRYFSVVSTAIHNAKFIPTPMALRAFLETFDEVEDRRPIVRALEVLYIYIYIYICIYVYIYISGKVIVDRCQMHQPHR